MSLHRRIAAAIAILLLFAWEFRHDPHLSALDITLLVTLIAAALLRNKPLPFWFGMGASLGLVIGSILAHSHP